MDFLTQLIILLSEPPGSFLYFIVTLFGLQIVFAICFGRQSRNPADAAARRSAWASGGIIGGFVGLLLATMLFGESPEQTAVLLPPLSYALDLVTVALLVWAFLGGTRRSNRLLDISLIVILVLTAVLWLFSWQAWQESVTSGATSYSGSTQASLWTMLQIAVLAVGLALLLLRERSQVLWPALILGILLVAHIVTLWNVPEFIATETSVAYWNRLAYLIVIPLWAVSVYQSAMEPIADSVTRGSGSGMATAGTLDMAAGVIATRQSARRTALGLRMAQEMVGGTFAALALPVDEDPDSLTFVSNLPAGADGSPHSWTMSLSANPALRTALGQESPVILRSDGLGARQFHALRQATKIETMGALLLTPLPMDDGKQGLLLVDGASEDTAWTDRETASINGVAHFLGQALSNSQHRASVFVQSPSPESPSPEATIPAAIVIDKALLRNVEAEREELRAALEQANEARRLAENNALAAQKQARYLAAALRVAQSPSAAGAGPASAAEGELNHE